MGMSINCALFVGLKMLKEDEEYEDRLDLISPFYDSPDLYIGIVLAANGEVLSPAILMEDIQSALEEFKLITGRDGELIVSNNIW